ncbi:phenylalanyl-tRNA synthetase alpha chain [Polymorphobacter multimanifer]|uniref:Phenylalanine--tRNA ligase alpha subunit n=1 Tax=Polymorphobacter multimanifer TaxID=1070431 RepID=A0A841LI95_9SPHN|nr:phenylalanine--tRNA ligase subunit alpha [Polymorphobacter multimanifer]MBB6228932.1 phenylalanyl-tRNA synthetase alpha chain [Polymorphobacter multimanifer]
MTDPDQLQSEVLGHIAAAASPEALEAVRVASMGKAGSVTTLMKSLGGMTPEQRQTEGPRLNGLREAVTAALAARKTELEAAALDARLKAERQDMTLPVGLPPQGSIHPVSQVMDELAEIFADMGFAVATGPEIEDDWHNFTALNIPEHHPARAMHDTFYVDGLDAEGRKRVLRTHTSPVQIRTMMASKPPIRIIAPGRVYRSDSDATHTPMFHQIEGLVIDKGITLAHLRWTLETFIKAFFEVDDVTLRFRPSYFPFTEPSVEVDVGYSSKTGKPAAAADVDKWLEVLGSGMVHPRVIAACGLDPQEWQGFAFGTGVDRLAMLKYGLTDLRAFFDGDLRWLRQHGFAFLDVPTLSAGVSA